jgi:hypothetical protein
MDECLAKPIDIPHLTAILRQVGDNGALLPRPR